MLHSWEVLAKILASEEIEDVVCDIGMYVHPSHCSSRLVPTVRQACHPQERQLQLPSHHSQQENPPHPAEVVVGE